MERTRPSFCVQGFTTTSVLTALSLIIATIALDNAGVLAGNPAAKDDIYSPAKDE